MFNLKNIVAVVTIVGGAAAMFTGVVDLFFSEKKEEKNPETTPAPAPDAEPATV